MTLDEIQQGSKEDPELRAVRELLTNNQIYKMTQPYRAVADELCITEQNILLPNSCILLPVKLKEQAIISAYEDHAGMTRCKQRL